MNIKFPKNDRNYCWTSHSKRKMIQYSIGPNLVKRVIRFPDRKEEGIVENTVASMRRKVGKSSTKETWVMYQYEKGQKRVISTWIFPGESPINKKIFVPEETWIEIYKHQKKKGGNVWL